MNFLQQLFNLPRPPSMPFNPAGAPAAAPMPQFAGNLDRMTQDAPNLSGAVSMPREAQILQAIGGSPDTPPVQQPQSPQPSSRPRRSFLDTIGQLSDVLARVGGAEALYQPTLDARQDRAREIDLEELRKQQINQQIEQGGQTLEAGEMELADTMRGRLANALGAVAGNPDAAAMWPQIAQQAGLDEQQAAAIGQILESNPGAAGIFAQSLGYQEPKQGSQAKELQVYSMLQQENPELAATYLQSIANPDSMSEYQRGQLAIGLARLGLQEDKAAFDQDMALEEREIDRGKAEGGGGADLTPKDRSTISMKLKLLPTVKTQYARVKELHEKMQQEGTFARGGVGGLLPGAIAGGTAEEFDKALGNLRKSILSMTRIPGVGAMSNYETMLDEQALPSRWGSDEGRTEAINGIGQLLRNYETGYREMLGNPAPARSSGRQAPRRNSPAPRGNTPAPTRRSVSPAAAEARRRGLIK